MSTLDIQQLTEASSRKDYPVVSLPQLKLIITESIGYREAEQESEWPWQTSNLERMTIK